MKSQKERIKNAMLSGRKLTSADGFKMFQCVDFRKRVSEIIAEKQHKITKTWKVTKTGKRVLQYSIDI